MSTPDITNLGDALRRSLEEPIEPKKPRAKKDEPVVAPPPWAPSDEDRDRIVPARHDIEEVRRRPVRFSNLKHMGRSPAHYLENLLRPRARNRELDVGTIVHDLVLGGGPEIVVYPGKTRQGKAWEAFEAEHADKLIVTRSTFLLATAAASAVKRNRQAMELLEGEREKELKPWKRGERECGGRPDVTHPKRIVELKWSTSAEPWWFTRNAIRLGYHGQKAWYLDGARETGGSQEESWIIVVEGSAPHPVQCMRLTDGALEQGRKLYSAWMELLAVCEASDDWPAYDPVDFDVPDYGETDDEELEGFDEEAAARVLGPRVEKGVAGSMNYPCVIWQSGGYRIVATRAGTGVLEHRHANAMGQTSWQTGRGFGESLPQEVINGFVRVQELADARGDELEALKTPCARCGTDRIVHAHICDPKLAAEQAEEERLP